MSDSEKPFACTTVGCNMSFVNEDHLTVHKKKHDMMLNLGVNNKSNVFIADQTPTPTRFIRNCEEVGLFQDLQNENPFEETFRRAVEAGKNGVLTVPEVDVNDDTLHTPNVFPHIEEPIKAANSTNHLSESRKGFAESATIIPLTPFKEEVITDEVITVEENRNVNTVLEKELNTHSSTDRSLDSNSGLKTDTHLPISRAEMQLLLKTEDGKVLRFVAAPVIEAQEDSLSVSPKEQNKTKVIVNNTSKPDVKLIQNQNLAAAKLKLKQTLTKNGAVVASSKPVQNNEKANKPVEQPKERARSSADHSKKQAILERNRASSMRSRAKRKAWIEQLQQSLKAANETNANLHAQVKSLHAQVEKLKTLLLAHKDCPVTKAMEEGNGIVIGSKVLTIKPNEIKQQPVVASPSKGAKRKTAEKPIVPKKKPLILSSVKSPILLQKTGPTTSALTLRPAEVKTALPTINIVGPVIANGDGGKTILGFLHSDTAKVPLIQNTFTVSENFDENAASKTTGT